MNFAEIKSENIMSWTNEQICSALIEAKKIETLTDFMKETLRNRVDVDVIFKVSNGTVKIGKPGMRLNHDINTVSERFLLEPVRPLNKALVRAHMIDSGTPPVGVSVKWNKKAVYIMPGKK